LSCSTWCLAGDNAIVIALAARNLPRRLQKRAVFWGTFGAVAVRIVLTLLVVYLLNLPGLMLVGGLLLLPIAWKLLKPDDGDAHAVTPAENFWAALRTIVVADALMGLDNVLAIAGAAKGHMGLVLPRSIDQHSTGGVGFDADPETDRTLSSHRLCRCGSHCMDCRPHDQSREVVARLVHCAWMDETCT
jgi:hypothetical protein